MRGAAERTMIAAVVTGLVAGTAGLAEAPGWQVSDGVAWTRAVETSDGTDARLEVRCEPEPAVRLLHDKLGEVPEDLHDWRPPWYRIVRVTGGWGLDLRRPDHHGATIYWRRCAAMPGCLRARDTDWIVHQLKSSWTWYLRAQPEGGPALDLRFDLSGSRRAIDAACDRHS